MRRFIYRFLVELTNGRWSSLLVRKLTESKFSKHLIPSFIKVYNINTEEFETPYNEYTTLQQFFIRHLKKGSRPIEKNSELVTSPVDGVIEAIGNITPNMRFLVKGKEYCLMEMLGSEEAAASYIDGEFAVIYLSPRDYHRIHSPVDGVIKRNWELGKKSYPVNRLGLLYGRDPLSKNYRRITEIKHSAGTVAIVKVGAMFVNSIEYSYRSEQVEKGEEIAFFSFGSTVILLFEKNTFNFLEQLETPKKVRMGETIGKINR